MQWYRSSWRIDALAELTIARSATPFDRLPIEALFLLTIIANTACVGLEMTRPTRMRLPAMLRAAWDSQELSVAALQEPEALFQLLRNSFKKQLVQ